SPSLWRRQGAEPYPPATPPAWATRRRRGPRLRTPVRDARAAPSGSASRTRGSGAEGYPSLCFDGAFTAMISSRVYAASAGDRRLRVRVSRRNATGSLAAEGDAAPSRLARERRRGSGVRNRRGARRTGQTCITVEGARHAVAALSALPGADGFRSGHGRDAGPGGDAGRDSRRARRRARARSRGGGKGDVARPADRGRADPGAAVRAAARGLRGRRFGRPGFGRVAVRGAARVDTQALIKTFRRMQTWQCIKTRSRR